MGSEAEFMGYQSTTTTRCRVVTAVTKAFIKDRKDPVLLLVHNATLIDDPSETESLLTIFDMMSHHIRIPSIHPPQFGGETN
jgi:hypothetical protein